MKIEIEKASAFLAKLIQTPSIPLSDTRRSALAKALARRLESRMKKSWDPNDPRKGQAFRCVSTHRGFIDPVIRAAVSDIELSIVDIIMPADFNVWIDPGCVAFRLGEFGSVSDIYTSGSTPTHQSTAPPGLGRAKSVSPAIAINNTNNNPNNRSAPISKSPPRSGEWISKAMTVKA